MAPKATTERSDLRTINFEPLDETNYHYWVMRMEAELIRRDLWSAVVVDEELDGKSEAEVAAAVAAWKAKRTSKKMAEARAEIVARVSDTQLDHFLLLRDPKEIWETLAGIHVARGLATRLALRRKFLRLVKDEKENMSAWIGQVKRMGFQLATIGVEVSDEDRILALTNGLDDSYESFVISLDSTLPQDLTLTYVVDRLLNDEMRRGNKGVTVKEEMKSETVMIVKSEQLCWKCGESGHYKLHCPKGKMAVVGEAHLALGPQGGKDFGTREVGQVW